jgi:hypothetical protein
VVLLWASPVRSARPSRFPVRSKPDRAIRQESETPTFFLGDRRYVHELLAYREFIRAKNAQVVATYRRSTIAINFFAYPRYLRRNRFAVVHA